MNRSRLTVLFDLDGTLVDSTQDIVDSFLHAFTELGAEPPTPEEAAALLGKPLEEMYGAFAPEEAVPELSRIYRRHYPLHFTDTTAPFPGVVEMLERVRELGYLRAVATTKRSGMAKELVSAVGLGSHLEHVQGTDGFPAKPDPTVIERALAAVDGVGVAMVGDSVFDVGAGAAAGLMTYAVTWGTGRGADLEAAGADVVRPDLEGLPALLRAARERLSAAGS